MELSVTIKTPDCQPYQKWTVLAAGVVLQAVLGGIYAWSAFAPQLNEIHGLSKGQCGAIFGLTIATFALAMIPAGKFMHRFGPRLTAATGSLLFTAGYILASLTQGNFLALLLSYGVVIGVGIGFGYVCPLTTGMKWFPENRGLVTGVAVAGFGGGAIILSSVTEYLLFSLNYSVFEVFRLIGFTFGIPAFIASLFISDPPAETSREPAATEEIQLLPSLLSRTFILVFIAMFAGTFAGLLIIGNLKPMMLDFGLSEFAATLSISLFALGNIAGRVFWGQVHDRYGSRVTILLAKSFFFVTLLLLHAGESEALLLPATLLIGAGFGGCFVIYASTIVTKFGVRLFTGLYPVCFLGYGLAALIGPGIGGRLADSSGTFSSGINLSLAVVLSAIVLILAFYERNRKNEMPQADLAIDND